MWQTTGNKIHPGSRPIVKKQNFTGSVYNESKEWNPCVSMHVSVGACFWTAYYYYAAVVVMM